MKSLNDLMGATAPPTKDQMWEATEMGVFKTSVSNVLKSWAPLTKDQWKGFSDKAKWDVQVALRGPDSNYGDSLKWFTTSVVRGHVRDVMRVGGMVNKDLHLVVLPQDRYWAAGPASLRSGGRGSKDYWNSAHFLEHIHAAAMWLSIPVVHIPTERWHEIMRMNSLYEAGKAIVEEVKALEGVDPSFHEHIRSHLDNLGYKSW